MTKRIQEIEERAVYGTDTEDGKVDVWLELEDYEYLKDQAEVSKEWQIVANNTWRDWYKAEKRLEDLREFKDDIIRELKAELDEKHQLLSKNCSTLDEIETEMYDAYLEIQRGKNGRALSIIEEYGREHFNV